MLDTCQHITWVETRCRDFLPHPPVLTVCSLVPIRNLRSGHKKIQMQLRLSFIRFFSIALCLCSAETTVQAQLMSSVETRLEQFAKKNVQEKLFVHTDREFYLAGDIAWFKLYLTDASFHRLLDLSKVTYVEILDRANKAIVQAKIQMNKG